jgi:aspirochlorine biosynthesis cytochrome P450 monooxygenase
MFPESPFGMEPILNRLSENWGITAVATSICIIFVVIALGDGTPNYPQFPFVGQGLLKPWLNWTTADRWRLHEYEPIAYEKVSFSALPEAICVWSDFLQHSKVGTPWHVTFWGLKFLIMPAKYLRDLRLVERHSLNLAMALSDALNMEASVGDVPTANTMEIDVVSKYLNAQLGTFLVYCGLTNANTSKLKPCLSSMKKQTSFSEKR